MKTLCISESGINEPGPTLSSALAEVEENQEIFVIFRGGKPVADLIPHRRKSRRTPHPSMGAIGIDYDPTEDLSQDEWSEEDEK
uniref:Antitoxin component of toxin-antitoxin stability system, DNA-binding transcriptional repressor n=1 Tax=Candidatus Kentrum sp. FW TaxID=2126338 RepID=A0A450T1G8_9GAMM|nr:MAG: hypothetical protein BECKFW1821A_GA0114235_11019 [Candidatus Kentron sp. FW]